MIGRFVDIRADLTTVTVSCAGQSVAVHRRCWDARRTITDPAHVEAAAGLRASYQNRSTGAAGTGRAVGEQVGMRALVDYDTLFGLSGADARDEDQAVVR